MKTIGIVGGTGWVSSVDYYRIINEETHKILGGHEFAQCILYSINFGEVVRRNKQGDSEGIYTLLSEGAKKLASIGADCILLGANTLHQFADRLEREVDVPLIHIAVATAGEIRKLNLDKVGLLGTQYTMEMDFYKDKLLDAGIETLVPEKEDRTYIHRTIFGELIKSVFKPETKQRYIDIMESLRARGAQGIILGCTEIPLLIHDNDLDMPLFNTTFIHSKAAVDFALKAV